MLKHTKIKMKNLVSENEKLKSTNKWLDETLTEFGEGGYGISQEELVEFYNEYKSLLEKRPD